MKSFSKTKRKEKQEMNRSLLYRKTITLFMLCLVNFSLFSQSRKDSLTYETTIQAVFQPAIAKDPRKISENPETRDSAIVQPKFNYGIKQKQFSTAFITEPIKPARMVGEPLQKLQRFMIKGGYGTYSTTYGEIFINNMRSKEYSMGFHAAHLASASTLENFGFSGYSDNELELYGKKFYSKNTLSGNLDYKRNVIHYYGYDITANTLSKDATKQVFNNIHPKLNLKSYYKDSSKINHDITFAWNNLTDIFKNTENNISANGIFSTYYGKEMINADAAVDYFNYRTPKDTFSNTLVKLNPSIVSNGEKFRASIGLSIFMDKGEVTRFKFYPSIYAQYNIINNIIIPYAGVGGGIEKNSYKSFSDLNPFLNPSLISYQNTDHVYKVYGGFKGSISKNTSFDAGASYSKINGACFFVSDVSELLKNRFLIIYDTINLITAHGELGWHHNKKYQVLLKGDYYNYQTRHLVRAWNSPEYKLTLSGIYNLQDKIVAHADIFVIGKQLTPETITISGKTVNTSGIKELKGIADINIGFEYRYSKLLSAFIMINNISSSRYYRWANYPSQKFSLLGGVSLSF